MSNEIVKLQAAMYVRRDALRAADFDDPIAEAEILVFHAAMREFQLVPVERRSPLPGAVVKLAEARLAEAQGHY